MPPLLQGPTREQNNNTALSCRCAGYFKPTTASSSDGSSDGSREGWCGSISQMQLSAYPPDAGPAAATPAAGVVTIGAVPWVTNYNVPLHTEDMAAAKAVARAVSSKGGGLPGVEVRAEVSLLFSARVLDAPAARAGAGVSCDWMLARKQPHNALNVTTPAPAALLRPALAA